MFAFGMIAAQAQTSMKTSTSASATVTLDTVTNAETEYLYLNAPGASYMSIQVVATKISGTPNGKLTMEVSHNGTDWTLLSTADSAHVDNVSGSQAFIFTKNPSPYSWYRISALGRGTAAYQIKATLIARKD